LESYVVLTPHLRKSAVLKHIYRLKLCVRKCATWGGRRGKKKKKLNALFYIRKEGKGKERNTT